ncbi:hypothetical protein H0O02_05300 [Candidatus Micrarchaeota archaeon]|nr:hypothetical protein [Candidatus Micrarchaeota archaeon]
MAFAEITLDWQIIAFAAAGISVFGSAMLIILSRAFNMKNLEQTAKTEFVYAASTVFIVLMIIGILNVGEPILVNIVRCLYLSAFGLNCADCTLTPMVGSGPGITGTPATTTIDYMKLYMETPVKCAQDALYSIYMASIPVESAASVYMEVFMSEPATGFGIKAFAERLKNTTQMLSFYLYIYYVLVHSLNFIKYYGGFFFALGVLLRAFPPTRGAGAYLMAAAIGFYLIFPFSYVLSSSIALPQAQGGVFTPAGGCTAAIEHGSPYYICNLPQVPFDVEGMQCGSASLSKLFEGATLLNAYRDNMLDLFDYKVGFIGSLTKTLVASICLGPLVAMIFTMTFILNTTNLFGGNIPEIGRGLVKLI